MDDTRTRIVAAQLLAMNYTEFVCFVEKIMAEIDSSDSEDRLTQWCKGVNWWAQNTNEKSEDEE